MPYQKFTYHCIECNKDFDPEKTLYLCPECSKPNNQVSPPKGVLKAHYNYKALKEASASFSELKNKGFLELMPFKSLDSFPPLKVGNTPFYSFKNLDGVDLPFTLHLKDDSQNPTFSFKDRASAIVSAYAKEKGYNTIVAASTGNAGSSLAGICASQKQKAIIMVPESAPLAKLTQIMMYGATIVPVKGSYDNAFDLSIMATGEFSWYNRNTAYNPLTIEGKKTVAFEIFEQMNFKLPEKIFVPVGDGVIISGVYKGFEDLLKLSLIDKIPTIVAVQSKGSDNLVSNLDEKQFHVKHSKTIADSISVDIPRNFYLARDFMQKYGGENITVTDEKILSASYLLSKNTGLFAEPAAAAAFAGMLAYKEKSLISENKDVVVLLTGTGLKDLKAVADLIKTPDSIEPNIEQLKKLI